MAPQLITPSEVSRTMRLFDIDRIQCTVFFPTFDPDLDADSAAYRCGIDYSLVSNPGDPISSPRMSPVPLNNVDELAHIITLPSVDDFDTLMGVFADIGQMFPYTVRAHYLERTLSGSSISQTLLFRAQEPDTPGETAIYSAKSSVISPIS